MLNEKEFTEMRKEIAASDIKREEAIQTSREVINLSKRIIYALHRNDIKEAESSLKAIESKKSELVKIDTHLDINIHMAALQEYSEALCYYHFIRHKKLPSRKELKLDTESYLLGVCDLTGELVRKAVNEVVNDNFGKAVEIKNLVEEIYSEFLKFNLRNSELRKKSDQIKWNLVKLQDVVYELKLKGKIR